MTIKENDADNVEKVKKMSAVNVVDRIYVFFSGKKFSQKRLKPYHKNIDIFLSFDQKKKQLNA